MNNEDGFAIQIASANGLAADSPVTQNARNKMDCMAQLTDKRTAQLEAMAQSK
jgi:hypothetical protein